MIEARLGPTAETRFLTLVTSDRFTIIDLIRDGRVWVVFPFGRSNEYVVDGLVDARRDGEGLCCECRVWLRSSCWLSGLVWPVWGPQRQALVPSRRSGW